MSTHPDKGDDSNVAMVDWRGRPAKGRQLGGPKSSFILLGAVICGYCAFGGIYFNLVLYLKEVLHEDSATAANDLTNLIGTVYFTCILGAFLADAYWGRIPTLMVSLLVFTVGCVLSSLAITIQQNNLPTGSLPHNLRLFLFVSLSIAAVGCGSFQPVIVSLGGDQFDEPKKKARFFSWVFVASNIGLILGLTVITYLESSGKWWLGFWISSAAAAVSVPLLVIGIPTWRQTRPGGNPLLRILQVIVCAAWKCKVTVPTNAESLYEVTTEKSAILGNRKISHTDTFRWLDKAATKTGQEVEAGGNPWRLCTVTQVEETKCVARIFPVVLTGVMYNVAAAQLFTLFVEQGGVMDTKVSGAAGSFHIPPGSMRLALNVAGITVPPLYEYAVVHRLRARTGHAKGLTPLQRMGCGLVTAAVAMAVAALVEMKRLRSLPNKLSILWLTPQFFIFGISNMFAVVAQMDFFYTEISDGMRSLGSSLFLVCMGLGNYVSTLLVIVVTSVSSRYLGCNWIPRNLNLGHLDYFYWLVLVLLMLTTFLFLLYASSYTYLSLAPPARPPSSSPPHDPISPLLVTTAQTTFPPLSTTSSAPQNHSPQSPASSSPPPASDPLTITSLHRKATRPA